MDALAARVADTRKYRHLDPGLVRRLAAEELGRADDPVKSVRARLHQAVCAYQVGEPRYDRWLEALGRAREEREASDGRPGRPDGPPGHGTASHAGASPRSRVASVCLDIMRHHASTRERLPILERFYVEVMPADTTSVVDVGCGLNPLAIPWMNLAPGARYRAYDVDADLIAFLNQAFPLLGVDGRAELLDAAARPELVEPGADVALVLKLLPLLPDEGTRLLAALDAKTIVVSFPTRTIGGARKGFARTYEARFADRLGGRKVELPGELAFVVERRS